MAQDVRAPILLTGANGFVGFYVQQACKRLDIPFLVLRSNLLDKKALADEIHSYRFCAVLHLGALTRPYRDGLEYYHTNVIGTENLICALRDFASVHDCCFSFLGKPSERKIRLVLLSSALVYAPSTKPLVESSPLSPHGHYALSKYVMEQRACDLGIAHICVRLFNTIGKNQSADFLLPKIIAAFKSYQTSITLGDMSLIRDFSDVRFVAESLAVLASAEVGHEWNDLCLHVNMCSGVGTRLLVLVEMIEKISGCTIEIIQDCALRPHQSPYMVGDCSRLFEILPSLESRARASLMQTLRWMWE